MQRYQKFLSVLVFTLLFSAVSAFAADAVIRGVVTDENGKPIRGALIRVNIDKMTMNRFSQGDGRFEVVVPPGSFAVTADAFGFAVSRKTVDTTKPGDVAFKLSPDVDFTRMSSAELEGMLPNTKEGNDVRQCNGCHGYTFPMRHAGWKAEDFAAFLPTMRHRITDEKGYTNAAELKDLSLSLEKIFGPDGMWGPDRQPDLSKITRTEMKDAALKATIKEWTIPTPTIAHSTAVDAARGIVWWGGYDQVSNRIGRFDIETEKFTEYPLPMPHGNPHTGTVLKSGEFVVALQDGGKGKMAGVDLNGKMTIYDWPGHELNARTAKVDPTGKTVWLTAGRETWSWDSATKQFTGAFKNPVPATFPEGSEAARRARPGQQPGSGGYDAVGDSKGFGWVSVLENGTLTRIDPKTGETKVYHTPEMQSVRGLAVDAQDNIWWGDFMGHKLGKLDAKTGQISFYRPPTPNATPYGVAADMKNGYIWFADTNGNQVTRFDPKTETFLEFPLPTRVTSVRFTGIDGQGRLWYSGYISGKLGVVDPEGSIRPLMSQQR